MYMMLCFTLLAVFQKEESFDRESCRIETNTADLKFSDCTLDTKDARKHELRERNSSNFCGNLSNGGELQSCFQAY
jgi:hypothetical protein